MLLYTLANFLFTLGGLYGPLWEDLLNFVLNSYIKKIKSSTR